MRLLVLPYRDFPKPAFIPCPRSLLTKVGASQALSGKHQQAPSWVRLWITVEITSLRESPAFAVQVWICFC